MANGNLKPCLAETLSHEGGFTNDKRDPGNWTGGKVGVGILKGTKKGIAAASYPHLNIKDLTDAQIAEIYEQKYWRPVRGDDLPKGVDLAVFDFGVNSGVSRASKYLQSIVGSTQDGKIGGETLHAAFLMDGPTLIKTLCSKRMGFVKSLAIWNTFGKGWSRRIAGVEAKALSWVLTKSELGAEAKAARDKATSQSGTAIVAGGGGFAFEQTTAFEGLPLMAIIAVTVLIAAPLIIRSIVNSQRASALTKAAKGA